MATIKEIAERAGVSVATVSRVINKSGRVSDDLQDRVLDVIESLHYQPGEVARGLRSHKTRIVGVVVPRIADVFFGTLSTAIEKTLLAAQYRMFMCSAEESEAQEGAYVETFLRYPSEGVILVPTGRNTAHIRRLIEQRIPIVLIDRDLPGMAVNRVMADNHWGAYHGARYLLELGHRRIVTVGGSPLTEPIRARMSGARQLLRAHGIEVQQEILVDNPDPFEAASMLVKGVLRDSPRPTAIFAMTDVLAVGVIHAAADLGLRVPDDLSVVGFDNTPLARYSLPELTTVAQPAYRMGELAAEILLRQMADPSVPVEHHVLDTQLIVRKSTAPPAASA